MAHVVEWPVAMSVASQSQWSTSRGTDDDDTVGPAAPSPHWPDAFDPQQ